MKLCKMSRNLAIILMSNLVILFGWLSFSSVQMNSAYMNEHITSQRSLDGIAEIQICNKFNFQW